MYRYFLILVLVIYHGTSIGQIQPNRLENEQDPECVVQIPDELKQFKRAIDIFLSYDNYLSTLLNSGVPVNIFCNHYYAYGAYSTEPLIFYHLYDQYLQHMEYEFNRNILYNKQVLISAPYVMNTEFGVILPEISGKRLSSEITSGIWLPTYHYQRKEFVIPVNLSVSYFFHK